MTGWGFFTLRLIGSRIKLLCERIRSPTGQITSKREKKQFKNNCHPDRSSLITGVAEEKDSRGRRKEIPKFRPWSTADFGVVETSSEWHKDLLSRKKDKKKLGLKRYQWSAIETVVIHYREFLLCWVLLLKFSTLL